MAGGRGAERHLRGDRGREIRNAKLPTANGYRLPRALFFVEIKPATAYRPTAQHRPPSAYLYRKCSREHSFTDISLATVCYLVPFLFNLQ